MVYAMIRFNFKFRRKFIRALHNEILILNSLVDNGEVFRAAIEKIPTFRGMKQSSREVAYLVKSVMNSDKGAYQVITGNEVRQVEYAGGTPSYIIAYHMLLSY